jgi:ubiquinone biosynthesis UbiH/UbiF/VisC/COQ6 family hydroxylase
MHCDVLIIGAGPVGLCLSQALCGLGLTVGLIERQSEAAIAAPAFDGREIALTHASMRLLGELGLWQRLDPADIAPLRAAKVLNGRSPHGMDVDGQLSGHAQLGTLVPNHRIRQAAWETVQAQDKLHTYFDARISAVRSNERCAVVELQDGLALTAPLLVAADSRFSETRRSLGLTADHHDFGKTMLVCRMRHEQPHHGTAWEWFGHGQTLALLPLQEHLASAVITVPGAEAQQLMELSEEAFAREVEQRFDQRLGRMELASTRHAYPLVGVYARHFVGRRFALAGDAAVGMHPVTAHGFNLGLASVERLRDLARTAQTQGRDLGDAALLARYERRHRAGTRPLYLATRAVVEVFTDDRRPMRLAREAILRTGQRMSPFRRALAASLVDDGPVDQSLWRRMGALLPR